MNKIKKILTVLIIGIVGMSFAFAQDENSDVSVAAEVGFESSYVFRGQEVGTDVVIASALVEINKVYVGVDSFWATRGGDFTSEIDLSGGLLVDDVLFQDTFLDIGGTIYVYPNADIATDKEYTTELYVGMGIDLSLVDLDGYVYYDIERQALTVVGSLTNTVLLLENAPLIGNVFWVNTGQIGFVQTDDSLGNGTNIDLKYGFANVSSNLVVAIKDVEVSVGARYNYADDDDVLDLDDFSWGVSAGYSF